jgi:DNA-binding transcriptional ArsR family regulator
VLFLFSSSLKRVYPSDGNNNLLHLIILLLFKLSFSLFTRLMTLSPDAELILTLLDEAPAEGLAASELLMRLARRGLHISQPTLSRRLRELREAAHIVQQGSRRGARYARDAIALHFSQPAEQRRPVNYNFNLIEDYVPNQNYWLSAAQRTRLRTAGYVLC